MTLYPMAKEILDNSNDVGCSRKELLKFIQEVKMKNPGLNFDLSLMDELDDNLWWVEILQNKELKDELMKECMKNPDDINHIYDVVLGYYSKGNGVEGNLGLWERAKILKKMLKEEVKQHELSATHKVLLVTHYNVMLAMSSNDIDPSE